jgi:DNA-binding response OmpR family regulator
MMDTAWVANIAPAAPVQSTILVVEPDPDLAETFTLALQQELQACVLRASTAEQALRLVKTATPDLLLIEYELAYMNGLDLYEQLCADERLRRVPALLIDPDESSALRSSRRLWSLWKPFDFLELLNLIGQLLLFETRAR